MQTTPTATLASPSGARGPQILARVTVWRLGLVSAGTATLANVAVLLTASALGADMVVRQAVSEAEIVIGGTAVMATTLVPILLATAVLVAVRRHRKAWRVLALIGLAVGLLTIPLPFGMVAQTGTQIALGLMHVITGVTWFLIMNPAVERQVI